MNKGFYLTLRIGSFNTDPAPEAVIDALTSVQVTSTVGSQGGFELKFTYGKNGAVAQLQKSGFFDPRHRVVIAITVNGSTEVLMDGIITKQDYAPSSAAGKSTFTVTGIDLTALMDFIDLTGVPYPAMSASAIARVILAKYAVLGVTASVSPTYVPVIPNPTESIPHQQGTDYAFIMQLASQSGAQFFLIPGPTPGKSTAYWGPNPTSTSGSPQAALSVNLDAATNVDSLSFSYDGTNAEDYYAAIIEPHTQIPIPVPIPRLSVIRPPQAARTSPALKLSPLEPVANESLSGVALAALGSLLKSTEVLTGSGQLDVLRYGRTLKARQLCAIRGAGDYYDGLYYVKSVTHDIKRGEYKQSFSFGRNGIGSSVKTVAV